MSTDLQPDPIPSSKNSDGLYEPFDTARVPVDGLTKGERFEMHWQHLSSFGGGTKIGVVLETLPAGKQTNQAHYHMLEEEHVYILEGELTVRLGKKHHVMNPATTSAFPPDRRPSTR
jgi:quercetin dioxygenase-like cupin family protein